MSWTVNQATDAILRRVRDVGGVAHNDVLLDVLSDCQRVVNACYGNVLTDTTFTTTANKSIYYWTDIASDIVRIVQVSIDGRILHKTEWRQLSQNDPFWMQSSGVPRVWDTIGHNLFVLSKPPNSAITVSVRYVSECIDLVAGGSFAVDETCVPLIMDLTCEVLLLRQRLFPSIEEAAQSAIRHANVSRVDPEPR